MFENATLARPYAKAIFAIANDAGTLLAHSEQLKLLAALVNEPSLSALIGHPRITSAALAELVNDVAGNAFGESMRDFVKVLADNGRLPLINDIVALFEQLRAEAENILRVDVTTAMELSEAMQERLKHSLAERFGADVELTARLDATLLAGVIVRAGDQVIDASARGRLQRLAQAMQRA